MKSTTKKSNGRFVSGCQNGPVFEWSAKSHDLHQSDYHFYAITTIKTISCIRKGERTFMPTGNTRLLHHNGAIQLDVPSPKRQPHDTGQSLFIEDKNKIGQVASIGQSGFRLESHWQDKSLGTRISFFKYRSSFSPCNVLSIS